MNVFLGGYEQKDNEWRVAVKMQRDLRHLGFYDPFTFNWKISNWYQEIATIMNPEIFKMYYLKSGEIGALSIAELMSNNMKGEVAIVINAFGFKGSAKLFAIRSLLSEKHYGKIYETMGLEESVIKIEKILLKEYQKWKQKA